MADEQDMNANQSDPVEASPSPAAEGPAEETADAAAESQPVESPAEALDDAVEPVAPDDVVPLPDFAQMLSDASDNSIELLRDVELDVKIELGRSEMAIEDILKLAEGSVVELDKLAGDPVDVLVNEQLVARGEVLIVNDNFCVRVNEIIPGISSLAHF